MGGAVSCQLALALTGGPACPASPFSPFSPGLPMCPSSPFIPAGPIFPGGPWGPGGPTSPGLPRGPFRKYQQHLLDMLMERRERERSPKNGRSKGFRSGCLTGPGRAHPSPCGDLRGSGTSPAHPTGCLHSSSGASNGELSWTFAGSASPSPLPSPRGSPLGLFQSLLPPPHQSMDHI